jgi:hypothetical protein
MICLTVALAVSTLSSRLEHFFSRYLLNLRLPSADLLDVFGGIHFLPLDKTTFLRIQCFINAVEEHFPAIKYTAFLYNDLLVWSSLAQVDIRILYSYLTKSLLPSAHLEHELGTALTHPRSPSAAAFSLSLPVSSSSAISPSATRSYGSFITGPASLSSGHVPGRVPKVFVNTSRPNEECHLVVYRSLSATLCLLTDSEFPLTKNFYSELDAYLGQEMAQLASDIGEQYTKSVAAQKSSAADAHQSNWKYLYFNHMNLAQKTSLHGGSRASAGGWGGPWGWDWSETKDGATNNQLTPSPTSSPFVAEVLGILSDMNTDLGRGIGNDGETIVKTCRDQWVIGKKSDEREVYVVIHQKHANLIEINEQLKTLCNTHFTNIFFLD